MVSAVQPASAQAGAVSLVTTQPWARRFNGADNNEDQAQAIVTDKDGNIIVGGYSVSIGGGNDFLTVKYSADGLGLWTNRYDSAEHAGDRVETVAVDGSGGVYVSGGSGTNIVTIKYTAGGAPVWTNTFGSTSQFLLFGGLAVDTTGNSYLLPSDFDSDSFIVVKYDVNGNPAWTNYYRTLPTSSDTPSDIGVDAAGNIFVTGYSFDSSWGGTVFLTIKYDPNGSVLWTQRYSRFALEAAYRLTVDPQGNVTVIGDCDGAKGSPRKIFQFGNAALDEHRRGPHLRRGRCACNHERCPGECVHRDRLSRRQLFSRGFYYRQIFQRGRASLDEPFC